MRTLFFFEAMDWCLYAARESLNLVHETVKGGAHLRLVASFLLYFFNLFFCLFPLS